MSVRDRIATYFEKYSRSRALQIVCATGTLAIASCSSDFARDPAIVYSTEHSIAGNEHTSVTLDLDRGSYLIEARERDIDLRLSVDVRGTHAEIVDAIPRHGVLAKVIRIEQPAKLRVELHSTDHRSKRGSSVLRIGRWQLPDASASATERELAFTAFGAAGEQTAAGTKESWTHAAEFLHEAIAHYEAAQDTAGRAQAQYTLGHLQYLLRDDRPAAIRASEAASEAFADLGDEAGVHNSAVLRAASEIEIASGMNASTQRAEQRALYDAADQRLAVASEYFEKRSLPLNAEYAVNMRGVRAQYSGADEEAGRFFAQAVEMARANKDDGERMKSLANLAWVHNRLGFISEAAKEYSELLPLIERDRQPSLYAAILNNLGLCLIALGDFDRALQMHADAMQMYRAQGQEMERGRQLTAIGALYFRTGDLQRSLDALRAAIDVQERINDGIGQASTLRLAGNAASALNQHDLALEYLRKSVQIDINPASSARARVLIASELRALGDLRGAEAELKPAIASGNSLARAEALDERGRLRLAQKNLTASIEDLRAADKQYIELGLDFNRIDTNATLSQALLATRDFGGAAAAADEAIAIVSRIRVKSANPEWRARFLSARYVPYEARIAAEFAAGSGDVATSWRAFRMAESVRARSLADLLADEPRRTAPAQDPDGDFLRAQLTALQLRLEMRMQRQDADETGSQELKRAIVETRARIDANRARREAIAANDDTLTNSLQKLQADLPPETAVLAYFVGDTTTHAWLLTRRELRHVALSGRAEMLRTTEEFVEAQRSRRAPARADTLDARLFGALFDALQEKRVLVIPDGPLNGLPFAALPMPRGAAGEMLIDRFVIGYAPSLSLALQARHESPSKHKRAVVIADPVYAPDDRRLAGLANGGNMRGPLPESNNKLTRLPYSGPESRAVVSALGANDTTLLSGFDATTARVLQLAAEDHSVLHFATHATARKESPDQSALYLTEYAPNGELLTDSRLTVGDITRAGLRADVVVLSGCETGEGGRLRGEGVLGLTYGFLANGSRSVVGALWPIEDAATAKFMKEFYSAYRESHRTADALRAAQLRSRDASNAAMWASFVVRANEFP